MGMLVLTAILLIQLVAAASISLPDRTSPDDSSGSRMKSCESEFPIAFQPTSPVIVESGRIGLRVVNGQRGYQWASALTVNFAVSCGVSFFSRQAGHIPPFKRHITIPLNANAPPSVI